MFIKKGDTVKVISGNSKGKTGKVLNILIKSDKVVVEGVNIVSRHTKPSNANPDGGIIKKEAPIAISNVQLVDT
ncbi:MAG: 50S ribosomal protein L24, partial [Bacilli bacterium]